MNFTKRDTLVELATLLKAIINTSAKKTKNYLKLTKHELNHKKI